MKIIEATSISQAFAVTADFIESWGGDYCWFRGVKNSGLKLLPGAYWRKNYDEALNILTFTQEGVAFAPIQHYNSWDTYQLAQHHGIPTRLLDWSESFSAALFFALDAWDGITTPCIWICKPELLNEKFMGWKGILAPESSSYLNLWLPKSIALSSKSSKDDDDGYIYDNDWPLAIYPKKANKRIAAQQGVFTVHGRRNEDLIHLFKEKGGREEEAFARVELRFSDKMVAFSHLKMLGVRRSAIYPDVDNLVKQIQEDHGW